LQSGGGEAHRRSVATAKQNADTLAGMGLIAP
jgi:hypothetical protein